MTNQEIRSDFARSLLGASIALGLLVDGLRGRIEPDVFSDGEHVTLNRVLATTHKAGEAFARLGKIIRERPER